MNFDVTANYENGRIGIPSIQESKGFWAKIVDQGTNDGTDPAYPDDRHVYAWIAIYHTDFLGGTEKFDGQQMVTAGPLAPYKGSATTKDGKQQVWGAAELNKNRNVPIGSIVWLEEGLTFKCFGSFTFTYQGYSPLWGEVIEYAPGKPRMQDSRYWVKVVKNSSKEKTETKALHLDAQPEYLYVCATNLNEPKHAPDVGWTETHRCPIGEFVLLFPVIYQDKLAEGVETEEEPRYAFTYTPPVRWAKVITIMDCNTLEADECDPAGKSFGNPHVFLDWRPTDTLVSKNGMMDLFANYQIVRWMPTKTENNAGAVKQYGVIINPQWTLKTGEIHYGDITTDSIINTDTTKIMVDNNFFTLVNNSVYGSCDGRVELRSKGIQIRDCYNNLITTNAVAVGHGLKFSGTELSLAVDVASPLAWNDSPNGQNNCVPIMHINGNTGNYCACCIGLVGGCATPYYWQFTCRNYNYTNGVLNTVGNSSNITNFTFGSNVCTEKLVMDSNGQLTIDYKTNMSCINNFTVLTGVSGNHFTATNVTFVGNSVAANNISFAVALGGFFLSLDQTTPQTTVGTFTFPKICINTTITNAQLNINSSTGAILKGVYNGDITKNGGISITNTGDLLLGSSTSTVKIPTTLYATSGDLLLGSSTGQVSINSAGETPKLWCYNGMAGFTATLCDPYIGAGDFYDGSGNDAMLATGLYAALLYGNAYFVGQDGPTLTNSSLAPCLTIENNGSQDVFASYQNVGGGIGANPDILMTAGGDINCRSINTKGNLVCNSASYLNGQVIIYSGSPTAVAGTTGTYQYNQPFTGASYKKVLIYFNGYTKATTSSFNFPTGFTKLPIVAANNTIITPTLATGSCQIPIVAVPQTGWIILEGY